MTTTCLHAVPAWRMFGRNVESSGVCVCVCVFVRVCVLWCATQAASHVQEFVAIVLTAQRPLTTASWTFNRLNLNVSSRVNLLADLTQLVPAALSPKWNTVWGEGNSTAVVTGRLQTIVPPTPKAQVDHRRLSADQRKEASPRIRTQGMIDSKEIGNLTELEVDEMMKWSGYRLGDIMKYWQKDFLSWRGTGQFKPSRSVNVDNPGTVPCARCALLPSHASVCRRFPASLGCRFLNIATSRVSSGETKRDREKYKDRRQREKIFTDILGETVRGQGKDIPSLDTVVVHVRLSDVLTRDNCWDVPPCVWRGLNGSRRIYVYPISWYDTVVQEIRNINTTLKVVVVGQAYHGFNRKKFGTQSRRSIEYRTRLVEYFKDHGFNASARPEHLPDDDFLYMTRSKFFVSGGGGFSRMIAKICRSHGGQVFSVMGLGRLGALEVMA
jgi:hypothetical protein